MPFPTFKEKDNPAFFQTNQIKKFEKALAASLKPNAKENNKKPNNINQNTVKIVQELLQQLIRLRENTESPNATSADPAVIEDFENLLDLYENKKSSLKKSDQDFLGAAIQFVRKSLEQVREKETAYQPIQLSGKETNYQPIQYSEPPPLPPEEEDDGPLPPRPGEEYVPPPFPPDEDEDDGPLPPRPGEENVPSPFPPDEDEDDESLPPIPGEESDIEFELGDEFELDWSILKEKFSFEAPINLTGHIKIKKLIGQGNFGFVHEVEADDIVLPELQKRGICPPVEFGKPPIRTFVLKQAKEYNDVTKLAYVEEGTIGEKLRRENKNHTNPPINLTTLGFLNGMPVVVGRHEKKGVMTEYLSAHVHITPLEKIEIILNFWEDLMEGIKFLHDNDVIHRDLAQRNILVSANKRAKISDHGYAAVIESDAESFVKLTKTAIPYKWVDDETFFTFKTRRAGDIFMLKVAMLEMIGTILTQNPQSAFGLITNYNAFDYHKNHANNGYLKILIKNLTDLTPLHINDKQLFNEMLKIFDKFFSALDYSKSSSAQQVSEDHENFKVAIHAARQRFKIPPRRLESENPKTHASITPVNEPKKYWVTGGLYASTAKGSSKTKSTWTSGKASNSTKGEKEEEKSEKKPPRF